MMNYLNEEKLYQSVLKTIDSTLPAGTFSVELAVALAESDAITFSGDTDEWVRTSRPEDKLKTLEALWALDPKVRDFFVAVAKYLDPDEFARAAGLTSQEAPASN